MSTYCERRLSSNRSARTRFRIGEEAVEGKVSIRITSIPASKEPSAPAVNPLRPRFLMVAVEGFTRFERGAPSRTNLSYGTIAHDYAFDGSEGRHACCIGAEQLYDRLEAERSGRAGRRAIFLLSPTVAAGAARYATQWRAMRD